MKKFIGILLALYLLTFLLGSPDPTIYYVDASRPNDNGNGLSEGAAWKTIGKVNVPGLTYNAGDSILFKRGEVWREQLIPPDSGSGGNPITFGAYGEGALPKILGSVTKNSTDDWTADTLEVGSDEDAPGDDFTKDYTAIYRGGPANATGTITQIKVWLGNNATGIDVKFGVFDNTSGNSYACRNVVTIALTGNSQDLLTFNSPGDFAAFAVQAGDFMGIYTPAAATNDCVGKENTGGAGFYYLAGDQTDGGTDDYGGNLTAAGRVYVWMTGAGVANHWRASSTVEIGNMIMDSEASMATMCANKVDLNVQGESWWDSGHSQIYMYSVGNPATFYSGSIECAGVEYLIDSNTKNYITLEYLDCRYTSNNGIVHRAGTNGIVDNCVLKYSGNTLSGNTHWNGSGIWVIANTNSIVSNNTVSYAFKGINPDTNNGSMVILVEDNVITNSIGVDGHADGILFSDGDWDGTYVQRNDISGFKDDGIDMYQGSNIVAQNNIIHDSVGAGEGNGIKMGMTVLDTGNEALRNHIYNLSGGTRNIGIAFNGAASCLAAYNIIHDVAQGMRVGNLDEVTDGDNDNNIMYNNVCYDCSLYGIFTGEGVGGGDQMTVTARNNITSATSRDISNGAFTVMTGGFNCLMNDASVWNAGTYNGAADDLYSTDPKFVDAANDDFRLLMASPCINAGTDVGLTTDYRGRSIRHAPDIGAYEDPTNVLFLTKLFNYIKERKDGKR